MPAGNTPSVSRRSPHRPSERSGLLLHEDEASETQQWAGRRGGRRVRLLLVITSLCLALIAKVAGDFSLSTCLTSLIQHHMEASAGFTKSSASSLLSAGTISYALGKLLTGQAYGGDPQKCMDALAKDIDAKVKDAGLL